MRYLLPVLILLVKILGITSRFMAIVILIVSVVFTLALAVSAFTSSRHPFLIRSRYGLENPFALLLEEKIVSTQRTFRLSLHFFLRSLFTLSSGVFQRVVSGNQTRCIESSKSGKGVSMRAKERRWIKHGRRCSRWGSSRGSCDRVRVGARRVKTTTHLREKVRITSECERVDAQCTQLSCSDRVRRRGCPTKHQHWIQTLDRSLVLK
mmetsp:Transcript_22679/g.45385  ORF Transcript_22679/g.45385 Transcript_22679/m.45385 type:complete len:208 (+) Transcript_22679:383-1006(+)